MRILLTGASSFTGFWFAKMLASAGHQVTASFRGQEGEYEGIRGRRISQLTGLIEPIWNVCFGDEAFMRAVDSRHFDLVCHHASEMTNYRSGDFDALEASRRNTNNARVVLAKLGEGGCSRLVMTGSVFEPYEGDNTADTRAFNPYGLSKHLSFELMRLEAERQGWAIGKFVIPNPFGPFEEARFTAYLAKRWLAGDTPSVTTPAYVRDNIPVSVLALDYVRFCEVAQAPRSIARATPSGYVETQGMFARRVAGEFSARTKLSCLVQLLDQKDFSEPLKRVNGECVLDKFSQWHEKAAWDEFVKFYMKEQ